MSYAFHCMGHFVCKRCTFQCNHKGGMIAHLQQHPGTQPSVDHLRGELRAMQQQAMREGRASLARNRMVR